LAESDTVADGPEPLAFRGTEVFTPCWDDLEAVQHRTIVSVCDI
jgi:hypothetical protein